MRLALCALSLVAGAHALIEKLNIERDPRTVFHIESFGFEPQGVFHVMMGDFKLMVPHDYVQPKDDEYKIALVLQKSNSDGANIQTQVDANPDAPTCFHTDSIKEGDEVISLASRTNWKNIEFEKTIDDAGFYHLYFSNCEATTQAGFNLKLEEYNFDSAGNKVYLPAGQASLPTWFFVICMVFVVQLGVWASIMIKQKENIRSIHWLMTICIVLKIMTLFFEAFKEHSVKTTGLKNDGWTYLFYIFSFLKGGMTFSVIVLIGTGWSYLKPFLTDRDKQLMLAVLVAQIMINIAAVVVDEETPGAQNWVTWRDILHLLDMICCCLILLPIVWSIRHLREAAGVDGKAASNFSRLKNFRSFYLLVVSYVYFTRIIVFLLGATLPFELTWLSYVFTEVAALVFYGTTGYLFRPQSRNPYLALGKDDDDAPNAEMAEL
jgi:hypothetical protein